MKKLEGVVLEIDGQRFAKGTRHVSKRWAHELVVAELLYDVEGYLHIETVDYSVMSLNELQFHIGQGMTEEQPAP